MSSYSQFLGASAVGYDFPFISPSNGNNTGNKGMAGPGHHYYDNNSYFGNYGTLIWKFCFYYIPNNIGFTVMILILKRGGEVFSTKFS